jgi:hypothetical protein
VFPAPLASVLHSAHLEQTVRLPKKDRGGCKNATRQRFAEVQSRDFEIDIRQQVQLLNHVPFPSVAIRMASIALLSSD